MREMQVDVGKMADAIQKELKQFAVATEAIVEDAVTQTAKETAKEIQSIAKAKFGGTGEYRKSWRAKFEKTGPYKLNAIVYARDFGWLAHLLEHSHPTGNGGHYIGRPHIALAEEHARQKLIERIKNGIESGKAGSL